MKIVHIANYARRSNGHVHMMVDLACAQADLGHEVHIVAGTCDFAELLATKGVHYSRIDSLERWRNPICFVQSCLEVTRLCATLRPDVVHAHMPVSLVCASIGRTTIGYATVATVHNEFTRQARLMRLADAVVGLSAAGIRKMKGWDIAAHRLHEIPNGAIGSARRAFEPATAVEVCRPAIGFVGGLHERKGVDDLLHAFDRVFRLVPNANLYIAGAGPLQREYERIAAGMRSRHNIHFVGHLDNPSLLYRQLDVFCLPSRAEPFGLVLVEAREAGCAIVATAVDGVPQVLDFGAAGLLVPSRDVEALSSALAHALEPATLKDLKERASRDLEKFSVHHVAERYIDLYRRLAR
jgi:glycosyltransferase involved in cell wall biosynthesis